MQMPKIVGGVVFLDPRDNSPLHDPRAHGEILYKKAAGAGGKNPCCDEHDKICTQDRTPIVKRPLG